tara:strand:+ start:224 stop:637 length:414 start_codon:yes stop_codon:yes gene_type:complete
MNMRLLILLFIVIGSALNAESSSLNLQLPGAPGNYQSDKFRAGELDCSNAIGSATNLEVGVTGLIDKGGEYDPIHDYEYNTSTDVGVYARITIPLGKRAKSRIDCNRLYDLELRKKQLEVMKLERELQQLRQLQFED